MKRLFSRERTQKKACFWAVLTLLCINLGVTSISAQEIGTASYYTYESCIKEGTSGICANGEVMKNDNLTCASWFYKFGTILLVTNLSNGRQVKVKVTDRGPSKRLVAKGRVIDLSSKAFTELDKLSKGIIRVKVEPISARDAR